jgi:hypothetical protein
MVGDGGKPNVYFVSDRSTVILATRHFKVAYAAWDALPKDHETTLEDRQNGVIASTEPRENGSHEFVTYDDSRQLLKKRRR